jgi:hypothetical protein
VAWFDSALELAEADPEKRYFQTIGSLEIKISDNEQPVRLPAPVLTNWPEIRTLIAGVAIRCVRTIRNYGCVPNLKECHEALDADPKELFEQWHFEWSTDEHGWTALAPPDPIKLMFGRPLGHTDRYASLSTMDWSTIVEALEDDLLPRPEDEFSTNAIEHFQGKNHRLAIIEAVIGLEIVLARFLREYLSAKKGFSTKQVLDFVNPNLQLTHRLNGVLYLILDSDHLKGLDLASVWKTVGWRNRIVHAEGHVPAGVTEDAIRKGLSATLVLIRRLGFETMMIHDEQNRPRIESVFSDMLDVVKVNVAFAPSHLVFIGVFLKPDSVNEVVRHVADRLDQLNTLLKERDARFMVERHLSLVIRRGIGSKLNLARWHGGTWEGL